MLLRFWASIDPLNHKQLKQLVAPKVQYFFLFLETFFGKAIIISSQARQARVPKKFICIILEEKHSARNALIGRAGSQLSKQLAMFGLGPGFRSLALRLPGSLASNISPAADGHRLAA